MSKIQKYIILFISAIIILTLFVLYWKDIFKTNEPCSVPLEFSIGNFDTRFNITRTSFLNDIEQVMSLWDQVSGKDLFVYKPNGQIKVNLIYDKRQQTTDSLKQKNSAITTDELNYNKLKTKYDSLVSEYDLKKNDYDVKLSDFKTNQADYNSQVDSWNSQGGAPASEYNNLSNQKKNLNLEINQLNQIKSNLDSLVNQINNLVPTLNAAARKINLGVVEFNAVTSANGGEFSEGEYIVDASGPHINIYQFQNNKELILILEHELGHALGLGHVDDPKAVMYRLNSSQNQDFTPADINALNQICVK